MWRTNSDNHAQSCITTYITLHYITLHCTTSYRNSKIHITEAGSKRSTVSKQNKRYNIPDVSEEPVIFNVGYRLPTDTAPFPRITTIPYLQIVLFGFQKVNSKVRSLSVREQAQSRYLLLRTQKPPSHANTPHNTTSCALLTAGRTTTL